MSASPSESSVYCSGLSSSSFYVHTGRYSSKKNLWTPFLGYYTFRHLNWNLSLCCWRSSWIFLFNMETFYTVKENNRYFRLDVQARKQSWQGCYLQSPIESPFLSASVCSLPSTNEILLFLGGNISIRVQVFKHEHLLPNQHFFT